MDRRKIGRSRARIGVGLATTVCAFACSASAKDHAGQNWYPVNVHLSTQVELPPSLVRDGQEAATTIFSRIRIQLTWTGQWQHASKAVGGCVGEPATRDLAIEIVRHAPASFSDVALAMALPDANSGVRIVIFYDRVTPLLRGHHAPQATVLGHVMAHEIAHVLQGVARHSETGIMRARWTQNEFSQMGIGVLTFAAQDVELIRRRLECVASTSCNYTLKFQSGARARCVTFSPDVVMARNRNAQSVVRAGRLRFRSSPEQYSSHAFRLCFAHRRGHLAARRTIAPPGSRAKVETWLPTLKE
jgi:hypothetical protein